MECTIIMTNVFEILRFPLHVLIVASFEFHHIEMQILVLLNSTSVKEKLYCMNQGYNECHNQHSCYILNFLMNQSPQISCCFEFQMANNNKSSGGYKKDLHSFKAGPVNFKSQAFRWLFESKVSLRENMYGPKRIVIQYNRTFSRC